MPQSFLIFGMTVMQENKKGFSPQSGLENKIHHFSVKLEAKPNFHKTKKDDKLMPSFSISFV